MEEALPERSRSLCEMDHKLSIKILSWLLLLWMVSMSSAYRTTQRLGLLMSGLGETNKKDAHELSSEFKTYYYTQTLDHFNYRPESYETFQQRYIVNWKYWGGVNTSAPIFVYLGAESSLDGEAPVVGFMSDNAAYFKALLVYIEHRYYGDSIPFGSRDAAYRNTSTLGYFSSTQAMADYAELIVNLKKNLTAENCPVIVIGASYGGMLASWFRLKYPHIALGALASSAPILYFDDIIPQNGYASVVTKDYQEASPRCYNTIRDSWSKIDEVAAAPNGLTILSQIFKTCEPLDTSQSLKDTLTILYKVSAQFDDPPEYPVNKICDAIDGLPEGSDILSRVAAGLNVTGSIGGKNQCNFISEVGLSSQGGWAWQRCSEMVIPRGNGENDTMFQADPFDLSSFTKECRDLFNVTPRPHWITTEFGGYNITSVLKRFGSNIIFSNGLRDPWSAGGVLENISHTVVAIRTKHGSHCLDLLLAQPNDPKWLVVQRKREIKIIDGWIRKYNHGLTSESGRRN